MARPVTLFTGQWADLPLDELAQKADELGYDGLELACWGDHFDVRRGARRRRLLQEQRELLERPRPAVLRDQQPPRRPGGVRPDRRAAPGDPAGARVGRRRPRGRAPARAPSEMMDTARGGRSASASTSSTASPARRIWHLALRVPADAGSDDRRAASTTSPSAGRRSSTRSTQSDVNFALEVHPDRDRVRHRIGRAARSRR